jgi:predicted  nucleic acid-binding Zn-ribbon protein
MKDGFDRSVAERMPKMQKRRPNRPWNVDPVLIRSQEEVKEEAKEQPPARAKAAPEPAAQAPEASPVVLGITSDTIARAVETIEDLHSEFSHIIFEKKDIQRKLMEHDRVIEEVGRENSTLRENLADLEKAAGEQKLLHKEITFLNEQIEDADHYIKHVVGMLEEKTAGYDSEVMKNRALEDRLARFSKDIQDKAKLDVKVSILEKDLTLSTSRIRELETCLEEEFRKRKPLEDEIAELKSALDRVYSSLSHIRLKAKREVYGS